MKPAHSVPWQMQPGEHGAEAPPQAITAAYGRSRGLTRRGAVQSWCYAGSGNHAVSPCPTRNQTLFDLTRHSRRCKGRHFLCRPLVIGGFWRLVDDAGSDLWIIPDSPPDRDVMRSSIYP